MFRPAFSITAAIHRSLVEIEIARREIDGLPLRASLLKSLRETALVATTHFSTQIEGNLLTLPEVRAVIAGGRIPGRDRDEDEVRNHFRAFAFMEKLAETAGPVTKRELRTLHGLVIGGKAKATAYRQQQNVIRDSASRRIVYLPPEAKDVPELMAALVAWINDAMTRESQPAPVIAAVAHYQFATIHPYLDGNGRTARLLATLVLRRGGYGLRGIYSLDEYYAKDLAGYYRALSVGTHNYYDGRAEADVTGFVSYFIAGMETAFRAIRMAASREGAAAPAPDHAKLLRGLDPRQRRLLGLFQAQGTATAAEMAEHLRMKPRTLASLCKDWVAEGFLEMRDPSRKARVYRLSDAVLKQLE